MNGRMLAAGLIACLATPLLEAAPFLEGTVQDDKGRPVEGASVKIWDCIGTCLGGVTVLTNADGRYVFEKKTFRNFPSLHVSMPGRYEVSRKESGPKLYEEDADVPRRVDFVLGTPAAATVYLEGDAPEGWTQKVAIRSGKDAAVHRYDVDPIYVSGWRYWDFEVLPRAEALHLVVTREPVVVEGDDPKETEKNRRENWKKRVEILSAPLRLVDPQRYTLKARMDFDSESETSYITVESITDALGADRTQELATGDPKFGPPADEAVRQEALALLDRVKKAAVPWNARPFKLIDSYEYDAVDAKGEKTHVRIDKDSSLGPAWSDISRLRGFAYMPPLRWLFSQPENVLILGFRVAGDRAEIDYRLKSFRGLAAGIGIGPGWNGFFSRSFSTGTIVIDTKTATVIEHRLSNNPLTEEVIETFGDYVAVGEGYAPQTLRIQTDDMDFRLRFHIHDDALWLLDVASNGDEAEPRFKIENVVVNRSH